MITNYFLMILTSVNAAYQFTHNMPMWGAVNVATAAFNLAMLIRGD